MFAKRIIPCLDVKDGRVVKGVNFVNLIDAGDPVEAAKEYNRQGADELVFLDITATSDNRASMYDMIRRTAEQVFIPLTVGGGIRTVEDIRRMLNSGADKVSLNSAAVREPELIRAGSERFGAQCIVLAIDARRVPGQSGRWRSTPTEGGAGRESMSSNGRNAASNSEPERFSSPAWTPTAHRTVMTAN